MKLVDRLREQYRDRLEHDPDPRQRQVAALCLRELECVPTEKVGQSPDFSDSPAPWTHVLTDLIAASGNQLIDRGREIKTGHEPLHSSSSNTCLSINSEKGVWWCSACQQGGTAVQWVMDTQNLAYVSARAWLTLKYGSPNQ